MQRHQWNSLGLQIELGSGLFELFSFIVILCGFDDMLLIS
jgi:hypothetical protein